MSDITEALDRILNWLQKHRPFDVLLLQPGLSEAEIEEIIADLPLRLPNDIRSLYRWKNGIRMGDENWEYSCIFLNWSFYPLQIIVDGYLDNVENCYFGSGLNPANAWSIFFHAEGTCTGYALADDKIQETSLVVFQHCKAGGCSVIIEYASLASMMLTIAECYENAYFVGTDGYLDIDDNQALDIWRKFNSEKILSEPKSFL
jgi:hypothetical protein